MILQPLPRCLARRVSIHIAFLFRDAWSIVGIHGDSLGHHPSYCNLFRGDWPCDLTQITIFPVLLGAAFKLRTDFEYIFFCIERLCLYDSV